jgi:hypothetical protein
VPAIFPLPVAAGREAFEAAVVQVNVVPLTVLGLVTVKEVALPEQSVTEAGETAAVGIAFTVAVTGVAYLERQPVVELEL